MLPTTTGNWPQNTAPCRGRSTATIAVNILSRTSRDRRVIANLSRATRSGRARIIASTALSSCGLENAIQSNEVCPYYIHFTDKLHAIALLTEWVQMTRRLLCTRLPHLRLLSCPYSAQEELFGAGSPEISALARLATVGVGIAETVAARVKDAVSDVKSNTVSLHQAFDNFIPVATCSMSSLQSLISVINGRKYMCIMLCCLHPCPGTFSSCTGPQRLTTLANPSSFRSHCWVTTDLMLLSRWANGPRECCLCGSYRTSTAEDG